MEVKGIIEDDKKWILRRAMKAREITQTELAEKLRTIQSAVCANINREKIGLETFRRMLDVMEYDVVIVDRRTGEEKWKLIKS